MPPAVGDPADVRLYPELPLKPLEAAKSLKEHRLAVRHVHVGHDVHPRSHLETAFLGETLECVPALGLGFPVGLKENHLLYGKKIGGAGLKHVQSVVDYLEGLELVGFIVLQIDDVVVEGGHYMYLGFAHFGNRLSLLDWPHASIIDA